MTIIIFNFHACPLSEVFILKVQFSILGGNFENVTSMVLELSWTYLITYLCEHSLFLLFFSLQFECINTLNEQLLEDVRVQLELLDGYAVLKEVSCSKLSYNVPGYVYLLLKYPEEVSDSIGLYFWSLFCLKLGLH